VLVYVALFASGTVTANLASLVQLLIRNPEFRQLGLRTTLMELLSDIAHHNLPYFHIAASSIRLFYLTTMSQL
jgi:hypothetical protein